MVRKICCACLTLVAIAFSVAVFAEEVPHPDLNIPYLCTFGYESCPNWGDDDFSQVIFFTVPEDMPGPLYVRIFDPDVGGEVDEIQNTWNSKTRFELYGGAGTYTNPDARGVQPEGLYKSGELLAETTYGVDAATDGKWVVFAEIDPKQGELVNGHFIFKLIIEGIEGDDGNLYKIDFSTMPDKTLDTTEIEVFAYEWAFRLPNKENDIIYTFPFLVPRETQYMIGSIWDFDNDNRVYLNTPSRPGLPAYSTGSNEWSVTNYKFSPEDARSDEAETTEESQEKRWFVTRYDIPEADFESLWTFQIYKGSVQNNDIAVNVADSEGKAFPLYSVSPPRQGLTMMLEDKTFEAESVTTDDILFIERDADVNADVTVATGSILPKGTKIAKGTQIPQQIIVADDQAIEADTVLSEDVVLEKNLIVQEDITLKKGSVLVENTQISPESTVHEGLAPGPHVLPNCNTILLDTSASIDPDGNPLTFTWDLGDGTRMYGERIIHTYSQPGSYVVNVVATDDSGAINDASSKAITVSINAPPVTITEENKWACVGETLYFDGSKSYDPDGFLIAQTWSFGDGTSAEGASATHAYDKPGVYSVRLDVMDNSESTCNTASDGFVVIVNDPPIAKAGEDLTGCDLTVQFDGRRSFDSDGDITEYLWYFGDGNVGIGPTPTHTYAQPGDYTVKLSVFDDSEAQCNTGTDELLVSINAPPQASAGPDQKVCVNTPVYFDGSGTTDRNGDSLVYLWDFGDDSPTSNQISTLHTYTDHGQFTARLTVQDNSGTSCATSQDTAIIVVDTKPVANAGTNQLVDVGQTVTFDGSGSVDPNGYPLTINWTFGGLSEPAEGISVTHVYDKPGVYHVLATVKSTANQGCNIHTDETIVTVNYPPIARAGTAFITHVDSVVEFDGKDSYDLDGSIAVYEWDFGDNSPVVSAPTPQATHSYSESGRYTVTLTVRDDTGLPGGVHSDTLVVTVNSPPMADAGAPVIGCAGQVIFDGTDSYDPDGNIVSYVWDFGDGTQGSGGRAVHLYKNPGVYPVKLTVTDNSGTASKQTSAMTAVEINGPPVVKIDQEVVRTCPDQPTRFDASASYDPNDDPLQFSWDFGDGERGTGALVEHVYTRTGRYMVNVSVSDGRNMMCSQTIATIEVLVNALPVADAGQDQLVNPNDTVRFDGTGSVDPDGRITEYTWDFGDGTGATGALVEHTYSAPGTYIVTLAVTDNSGLQCDTGSDDIIVTVNASPIADAGPDQIDLCSKTVSFDGTGSGDPDGTIVAYEWNFGDGSPIGIGPTPTHTYTKPGTYNVTLRVTDDSNLSSGQASHAMQVGINDAPVAKIQAPELVCPGENVTMNAGGSSDSDGSLVSYDWDFGDSSRRETGKTATHSYSKSGEYFIELTVTDDSGSQCNTGTAKHLISVNFPPVAVAGDDIITCVQTTGCSFTLDAGNSRNYDDDRLTYHWDLGDGNSKKGIRVQYEYANPGSYTVTLTVTDDSGLACNVDTDTLRVTANAPPDIRIQRQ